MPQITFIQPDGSRQDVDAPDAGSVMQAAVQASVPGIDADCGGACACATCHVYVDAAWLARLPPAQPMEADLLECAHAPRPESRLSCQLVLSPALDGLVLHLPPRA